MLDLGCGGGRHAVFFCKKGFEVVALDINPKAIRQTKERLKGKGLKAKVLKADMNHLPFPDESFDAVLATHVIEHQRLKGVIKSASEIHRVMRKDGKALITLPSTRDPISEGNVLIGKNTYLRKKDGVVHHYFSKKEIKRIFRRFSRVSATPAKSKSFNKKTAYLYDIRLVK